ncbi:MAG: hypothetical protein WCJ59_02420 [bacterium]
MPELSDREKCERISIFLLEHEGVEVKAEDLLLCFYMDGFQYKTKSGYSSSLGTILWVWDYLLVKNIPHILSHFKQMGVPFVRGPEPVTECQRKRLTAEWLQEKNARTEATVIAEFRTCPECGCKFNDKLAVICPCCDAQLENDQPDEEKSESTD